MNSCTYAVRWDIEEPVMKDLREGRSFLDHQPLEYASQPNPLYIFLDESGDFNFSPRGTKYFTITAISLTIPI